ncbi:p-loop containing nucleoside triphosphate hydrolase protein [Coniochaeta hoffmannii]|uniref:P-loop containing nucleoside triphosphate hydrolase protein n=1 Tax=Coniochaeta hoffmannii TaxID=91930 RepID=A0AA38SHE7_9PEZI|nr:p-loop containing nucleoside triphosphate hydrolase protein [Coniochaeta hoffmannii]
MPLRQPALGEDDISKPFTTPTSSLRSPEDLITTWQWMTVSWMSPLIGVGKSRQIHGEDVWFLPLDFQHTRLHQLFRDVQGSVIGRLFKANGTDLIITCCLGVFESLSSLSEVVFLKQMLGALDADDPNPRSAIVYSIFILLARLAQAQSGVFSLWFSRRCYERSRGEMITMIYQKTLRRKAFTFPGAAVTTDLAPAEAEDDTPDDPPVTNVVEPSAFQSLWAWARRANGPPSKPAESPASTGKILNLMRNDVYEVAQRFWEFPSIITKPLNFILSMALIWHFLGPASLLGLAFLVVAQLINAGVIRAQLRVERARRAVTDSKLQMTSQFVESIRHLRWYDWHEKWLAEILALRQAELYKRLVSNLLSATIMAVNQFSAYLLPVAGFFAYTVISGKPLRVEVAFPALDLFSMLQVNLRELPGLVTVLLNARVAMGRIEAFMAEPDKESLDRVDPPQEAPKIEVRDASFSWPGCKEMVLRNASFTCTTGLTVVCGKVGIGKTALLQAILGELDQHGGVRNVSNEVVGYCAQSPWLESMSIRDNILFCRELDESRYRQVLDICCLIPDLENFKAGDLSLIGENGVGLSGGQRARVALARALYSQARILLLDDPIAALDHQTAETILRKLFVNRQSPLIAGRLVVFVTHRVNLITPYADQVLEVVGDGRVKTLERDRLETDQDLRELAAEALEVNPNETTAVPDKFIEEEHRAAGGVMAAVYWKYIRAGSLRWWAFLIATHIFFRVARVWYFWFLKRWGEAYGTQEAALLRTAVVYPGLHAQQEAHGTHKAVYLGLHAHPASLDLGLPDPGTNVNPWLVWFLIISMVQAIVHTISDFVLIVIIYNAGKRLFADVMRRVSNATFRFYDVTPVGRLMNRLTSDIGTIDGQIAGQLMNAAWYGISWLSSVVVIASTAPAFLFVTVIMSAIFIYIFVQFLPTSQSLRRLEMVSLSPMMSNFGTLLDGLITVRAFKAQADFQQRMVATTDTFQKMDHFYWSLQSWLTYRFELCAALATFTLTMTALTTGLSAGSVGFVLAAASNFVIATHSLCKRYGELQMQFVSVERVIELLDLEQEDSEGDRKPPAAWPTYADDIEFDSVTLRYAPGLDPSLQDVSFRIPAGSTVAVTGRTGSGKSTLALSLLATILPDAGAIRIGGVDISKIDKHALRRRVTFVAQDPVLFPGTLQDNLDPQREHSDEDCAAVLARVMHGGASEGLALKSRVDGGGKNLSQGQRQLVGLGRAVLRRSPIVILDEATASIDVETAFYIQEVLREELKQSTVITIAHRVEAVKDADYRIVLDKGQVVEAGPM